MKNITPLLLLLMEDSKDTLLSLLKRPLTSKNYSMKEKLKEPK